MPFEKIDSAPRRIAVIGGGISGMAAAHLLGADNDVVLFENETRLGGHARTIIAGKNKDQPVDTGFIVFNRATYPHLCALFKELDVPIADSDMSFAASARGGRLEYSLSNLDTLFAQRRNIANPAYLRMLSDIMTFFKKAEGIVDQRNLSIAELLAELKTGPWFRDYFLTPFSGAIWSTPCTGILDFPAKALVTFFRNHGLMGLSGQHQWYTVRGGSVEYVNRLEAAICAAGTTIRTGATVQSIRRENGLVFVKSANADWEMFDAVVLACHSDQALALLSDPTEFESTNLSAIRYQPNEAVLHSDPSAMPSRRKTWSSWNYREGGDQSKIQLTYWMNRLQPIPEDDPLFVTLNAAHPIREDLIHDVKTFHHPVYDRAAWAAQERIAAGNGAQNTWFCGAWMRNGFHEDGIATATEVVTAIRGQKQLIAAE